MTETVRSRPNHYQTLGVAPTARSEEIARAFAREGSVFRPHAFGGLAEVCLAYETLRDPIKRRAYDASLDLKPEPALRSSPIETRAEPSFQHSAPAQPFDRSPVDMQLTSAPEPKADPPPPPAPIIRPQLEPEVLRGDLPRFGLEGDLGPEISPIDWRRVGTALGSIAVAACVLGGLAGWWSSRDVEQSSPPASTASVPLPSPEPLAAPAPPPVPAPMPAQRVPDARPERPRPAVATAMAARAEQPPTVTRPVVVAEQSEEKLPDLSANEQVADETQVASAAVAAMPLPNRVIARTIERIGYSCGSVTSTTPVDGDAPGVFKVTCASGQSYQAKPINGRYHFRRWGRS